MPIVNPDALLQVNLPSDYNNLTTDEQMIIRGWIGTNLDPVSTFNLDVTSYGLKHKFERSKEGFYVSNGQFKGAMLDVGGFKVKNTNDLNWQFNISKRSITRLTLNHDS